METGYIKIHRDIFNFEWYTEPLTTRLYAHLIYKANHKDTFYRGEKIDRGQVYTGRKQLALDTGLGEQSIRTALKNLESTGHVTSESTNQRSIITIKNYNKFQDANQQTNQPLTSDQPAGNQPLTTYKKLKKLKNEKNVKEYNNILVIWNDFAESNNLSSIISLSKKRITNIKARSKESDFNFQTILDKIQSSSFLKGDNKNGWKVDFDWIFGSANNYLKIIEGRYDADGKSNKIAGLSQEFLRDYVNGK